jgi:hypothetical protein
MAFQKIQEFQIDIKLPYLEEFPLSKLNSTTYAIVGELEPDTLVQVFLNGVLQERVSDYIIWPTYGWVIIQGITEGDKVRLLGYRRKETNRR